jgi:15-cis-phytoene synthase
MQGLTDCAAAIGRAWPGHTNASSGSHGVLTARRRNDAGMTELLETLPVLHRLALAYAPGRMRDATLALLALDNRLAGIVRSASEPMLAQVRLAWWRDMLGREAGERPSGEPLIAALGVWGSHAGDLAELVDGWEHLAVSEVLDEPAIKAFCAGRGAAFAALAAVAGRKDARDPARRAGEGWALADLAGRLDDPGERAISLRLVGEHDWSRIALPRDLRPLAVLHGLSVRAGRAGTGLDAPAVGALVPMVRIGLFGR